MSQFKAVERSSMFMIQITDRCVLMYNDVLYLMFLFQEADVQIKFGKLQISIYLLLFLKIVNNQAILALILQVINFK